MTVNQSGDYSFELTDDASGRFQIEDGELIVANGDLLNYFLAIADGVVSVSGYDPVTGVDKIELTVEFDELTFTQIGGDSVVSLGIDSLAHGDERTRK